MNDPLPSKPGSDVEQFSLQIPQHQTDRDREFAQRLESYFAHSPGSANDKLRNFTKYVPRQSLTLFLGRHEIFRRILRVHGHILECGVFLGGGLLTWTQLSTIYEPNNHVRRVIGFDTFSGFPAVHEKDQGEPYQERRQGGLAADSLRDIQQSLELVDLNRAIGHIPRAELVRGDACQTIPDYLAQNPHLVVSLLYLDFDLYEPTKVALDTFAPRMPKGAVIAFDELNQKAWPGETLALMETVGIPALRIERFPFVPQLSFAVLE